MYGSAESRNHRPRGLRAQRQTLIGLIARSPKRATNTCAFLLTLTYIEVGYSDRTPAEVNIKHGSSLRRTRTNPTLGHR